jgi:hypothetical protein
MQIKRKEMKANESKIPFISFHFLLRIGTFQWVKADSNKKIILLFDALRAEPPAEADSIFHSF